MNAVKSLPILESCSGCGACCLEQESPPMYIAYLAGGAPADAPDSFGDAERVNSLPDHLRLELLAYIEHLRSGKSHPRDGCCIWFDEKTRGCRNYEWRPQICRDFERGTEECRNWRNVYGVDLQGGGF